MTDNPLAGISIPSMRDIAERTIGCMGIATVDLGNPLQRARLAKHLEYTLTRVFSHEIELAVSAATTRAVTHVFRVMQDADYQEKRRKSREHSRKLAAEKRQRKQEAERQARMDYSRRKIEVSKATLQ